MKLKGRRGKGGNQMLVWPFLPQHWKGSEAVCTATWSTPKSQGRFCFLELWAPNGGSERRKQKPVRVRRVPWKGMWHWKSMSDGEVFWHWNKVCWASVFTPHSSSHVFSIKWAACEPRVPEEQGNVLAYGLGIHVSQCWVKCLDN